MGAVDAFFADFSWWNEKKVVPLHPKVVPKSVNFNQKVVPKSVNFVQKVVPKSVSSMLKRKIYSELEEWKRQPDHKPLIIQGCRQCGKTFSVMDFAGKNYKQVLYLNFFERKDLQAVFAGSLSVDDIMLSISTALRVSSAFPVGETCLIFDEIQECPAARTALKFFKLDGRYDVLCTGSLLGVRGYREQPASIPVGYETHLNMYPLDFEEFLWANGIDDAVINRLRRCLEERVPVPEAIHQQMRQLLLRYTIVGGMPEVVNEFVASNHLGLVLQKQRDIVETYRDDMIKYASSEMKSNIVDSFDSIPRQLSKENKKFQYSVIKKGARASKYENCLRWIEDAGIIRRCYNLSIPQLPYKGNSIPDVFKVYMVDTGLFASMLDDGTQFDILQGNLLTYKGAIFENLVADILTKNNRPLYYFHKENGTELDFLIRYNNASTALEVKAKNGNAKSLKTILAHPEKYGVSQAIKLVDGNVGFENGILTLPSYMTFLL